MSYLSDDLQIYPDDFYNVVSDKEYSDAFDDFNKENSDGKIRIKNIKCIN